MGLGMPALGAWVSRSVRGSAYHGSMLDEIVARIREDLPAQVEAFDTVRRAADARKDHPPSFIEALGGTGLAVIAEVKRRSPSGGDIDRALEARARADRYVAGGAAAISVLTERHFFEGSPEDLAEVAESVAVPVLRKDFIIHPVQVWQARAWGAAAVLLIAAILDDAQLHMLRREAESLGMAALVEAHDGSEVERALRSGASLIGVNNRDLSSFEVDLNTAERLRPLLGEDVVSVAESGVWSAPDARRMRDAGYDAVLVGEALVRADDPATLIESFR